MRKFFQQLLGYVESVAYLLAFWSLLVLFFEPVIGYYTNYTGVELYTALANLAVLGLAILNRVLYGEVRGTQKMIIFDIILLALGILLVFYNAKFVIFFLLIRQTYFILQYLLFRFSEGKLYRWLSNDPPITLIMSFAIAIFIGTILLMMPVSSAQNRVTPLVNALFTATSATCVTGLIVVDTGSYWSMFGQMVILILIQLGGLGIMTVSTVFALLLGRNINLKLKHVMTHMVGGSRAINIIALLKNIVLVTAVIEAIGAVLLFFKFSQVFPTQKAIYFSIFHSISSFCNAGFSTFSDNLMGFGSSIIVSLVVPLLIFIGGIGFTVIIDLGRFFFTGGKVKKLSLHSKIVLSASGILIVAGFIDPGIQRHDGRIQPHQAFHGSDVPIRDHQDSGLQHDRHRGVGTDIPACGDVFDVHRRFTRFHRRRCENNHLFGARAHNYLDDKGEAGHQCFQAPPPLRQFPRGNRSNHPLGHNSIHRGLAAAAGGAACVRGYHV